MSKKMREEFEAWHFSEVNRLAEKVGIDSAARFNESMEDRWPCWQASRSAVSVGIPKPTFLIHLDAQRFYQGQIVESIKAQGFKCEVRP